MEQMQAVVDTNAKDQWECAEHDQGDGPIEPKQNSQTNDGATDQWDKGYRD